MWPRKGKRGQESDWNSGATHLHLDTISCCTQDLHSCCPLALGDLQLQHSTKVYGRFSPAPHTSAGERLSRSFLKEKSAKDLQWSLMCFVRDLGSATGAVNSWACAPAVLAQNTCSEVYDQCPINLAPRFASPIEKKGIGGKPLKYPSRKHWPENSKTDFQLCLTSVSWYHLLPCLLPFLKAPISSPFPATPPFFLGPTSLTLLSLWGGVACSLALFFWVARYTYTSQMCFLGRGKASRLLHFFFRPPQVHSFSTSFHHPVFPQNPPGFQVIWIRLTWNNYLDKWDIRASSTACRGPHMRQVNESPRGRQTKDGELFPQPSEFQCVSHWASVKVERAPQAAVPEPEKVVSSLNSAFPRQVRESGWGPCTHTASAPEKNTMLKLSENKALAEIRKQTHL